MGKDPKRRGNQGQRPGAGKQTAVDLPATASAPPRWDHFGQLEAIIESIDEGLIVADPQGNVLWMNRRALEIHEFASVDEVQQALPQFADMFEIRDLPGNVIPVEDWPLGRTMRGETFSEWELRVLNKRTGRQWFARYDGTPVRDKQGNVIYTVLTLRDITGQKMVEDRLHRAHEQNRRILASITDGFIALDREYRYTFVNEAAAAFLKTTPEKLIGRIVWEAFPESRHSRFYEEFTRAAEKKVFVQFEEYYEPLRCWYECRCYPSDDGLTVFFTDTTDRRQAHEDLRATYERLQDQNEKLEAATEELQAQASERQESEQRLARAQEIAHLGSWELDLVTGKLTWSDEVYRIFGVIPRLFGATYEAFLAQVHPDDRVAVEAAYSGSIRNGRDAYEIEHRIVLHETGEVRWVHERCVHVRDESGQIVRSLGMVLDITDRKEASEAIRNTAMFPEQNPSPVLRVARDGTLLYANKASADVLEMWGCRTGQRVPEHMRQAVAKALDSGEILEKEIVCGQTVHSFSLAPIAQEAYVNLYSQDVTARKEMEEELWRMNSRLEEQVQTRTEELRDSVERLQEEVARRVKVEGRLRRNSRMLEAFFQHTITPLAFLDGEFNFVRVNEAYAQADGRTCEYFVGKNHFALYPNQEHEAIFRRVVQTRQPYQAFAKPFAFPDDPEGRTSYWNWQITPLLDEWGEVENLVFNLEDVTERQLAVQELERRAHQLQRLTLELSQAEDRERKRLAEILHDDLQQQLAATKFHLGVLAGRVKEDAEARQMAALLDGMLKDAIEKSRNLSHELSPAVLYQSDIGETFVWLANQVRAKHGLLVHVAGNGIRLQSDSLKAFLYKTGQEMLFNVVKHARVKEARIRVRRLGRHVGLVVSDRGRGFDPEALSNTTGFGLLSVRERVELLGGRMKIRSTAGKGSRFLIVVPDGEPSQTTIEIQRPRRQARSEVDSPRESPRRMFRVVVADDHEIVRQGLAALFAEEADMELVGEAANGREAVDAAHRLRPDVVIMDVSMPLMSGDEATRQIKAHVPGTRVIALSMFAEAEMALRMHRAGAEAYLLKTDPSEELLAAIRSP